MKRLLIVRFSALGDVAMMTPAIYSLANKYPDLSITVMSKPFHKAFFEHMPQNVEFWGVNLHDYKHITGLERLFREVESRKFDAVADMHDVLRTKYLRFRLKMTTIPVAHINKERKAKRALIKDGFTKTSPLRSSFERYADVLKDLGFPISLNFRSIYGNHKGDLSLLPEPFCTKPSQYKWIGVAPFAAHEGKIYPLELMEKVIEQLNGMGRVFLFGGGETELKVFDEWQKRYQNVKSVASFIKGLDKELILMSHLSVMLSMDSGNMHMASIVETPVVSVWGATHPNAGFLGWKQPAENIIQAYLPCRPCSIYGNKPCQNGGNYPCLRKISPEQIVERIKVYL